MTIRTFARSAFACTLATTALLTLADRASAAALLAQDAPAVQAPAVANPQVAVFNLKKTFAGLAEHKAALADLTAMAGSLTAESTAEATSLKALQTDLNDLQPGGAKHKEAMDALSLKTYEYQANVEFRRMKLEGESARRARQTLANIEQAVRSLAAERGYLIVLATDASLTTPGTSEDAAANAAATVRVMYSNAQIDVTEALTQRMNDAFAAKVEAAKQIKP